MLPHVVGAEQPFPCWKNAPDFEVFEDKRPSQLTLDGVRVRDSQPPGRQVPCEAHRAGLRRGDIPSVSCGGFSEARPVSSAVTGPCNSEVPTPQKHVPPLPKGGRSEQGDSSGSMWPLTSCRVIQAHTLALLRQLTALSFCPAPVQWWGPSCRPLLFQPYFGT